MLTQKSILSFVDFGRKKGGAAPVGVDAAQQPTVRGNNLRFSGSRRNAKDLIGLLIGHSARLRRSAMPRSVVRIDVFTPSGKPAVEISFE